MFIKGWSAFRGTKIGVATLMSLQTLSAFSTPSVFLHHCPLRDQYWSQYCMFCKEHKSISPQVDCLRKGYWVLHLSAWLVNFTRYFFSLLTAPRQHLLPPFLKTDFDGNWTLIEHLGLWDSKWKLLSTQKNCCKQIQVFGSMVNAKSGISSSYAFSGKNVKMIKWMLKIPGDPLCFSNCVPEVCLASIKRKLPEFPWGLACMVFFWMTILFIPDMNIIDVSSLI